MDLPKTNRRRMVLLLAVGAGAGAMAAACRGGSSGSSGSDTAKAGSPTTAPSGAPERPGTLRLGYFPNLTHATALAGMETGIFAKALGPRVELKPAVFNAGPAAIEAIFSGALDASYIGPNPAINAHVRSKGEAIRIIGGAASGGAALVVQPDITETGALRGKKVASPQLGGTQDVALRMWLRGKGLRTDPQGGGDVSIAPQENAQTLEAFRAKQIAGAWVPEPWATRLVQEGGGKVLVDERDLWPGGRFVTTHLIVTTKLLKDRPDIVGALLRGHVEATSFVTTQTAQAQQAVNQGLERLTGRGIAADVLTAAWKNITFTNDPVAESLRKSAVDAETLGLLKLEGVRLETIYDITLLNQVLRGAGLPEVVVQ